MLIDWFTVIAQVVNFLVLVWLLRRFLYTPILAAIDAREKSIVARFAEAEQVRIKSEEAKEDFQRKRLELEERKSSLLQNAVDDARTEHDRLLVVAESEANSARSNWQDALQADRAAFGDEIVRRTQAGVFDIARKTLAKLASTQLEECMVNAFIAQLRVMDVESRDKLTHSLNDTSTRILVRTAFDLPMVQRDAIVAALRDIFAVETPIQYETAPNLVSGIELATNGEKVTWSIADFLSDVKNNVDSLIQAGADREPRSATAQSGTHPEGEASGRVHPAVIPVAASPVAAA